MLPLPAISGERDAYARYHHHSTHHRHTVGSSMGSGDSRRPPPRRLVSQSPVAYPYMVGNRLYNERYHDWDYDRLCGGPSLTLVETLPSGW